MRHVAAEESLLIIHEACELCLFHLLSIQHQNSAQERELLLHHAPPHGWELASALTPPSPGLANEGQHQHIVCFTVRVRPQGPQACNKKRPHWLSDWWVTTPSPHTPTSAPSPLGPMGHI